MVSETQGESPRVKCEAGRLSELDFGCARNTSKTMHFERKSLKTIENEDLLRVWRRNTTNRDQLRSTQEQCSLRRWLPRQAPESDFDSYMFLIPCARSTSCGIATYSTIIFHGFWDIFWLEINGFWGRKSSKNMIYIRNGEAGSPLLLNRFGQTDMPGLSTARDLSISAIISGIFFV